MSNVHTLIRYTGGALNTNAALSLGGAASQALGGISAGQSAVYVAGTIVTGVYVLGAENCPIGLSSLQWDNATGRFTWTDSTLAENAVDCNSSGYYLIAYGSSPATHIWLYVDYSSLPAATVSTAYQIQNKYQRLFGNVPFSGRSVNIEVYRSLFIHNVGPTTLEEVTVAMATSPANGVIDIGSDYATNAQDSDGITTDLPTIIADQEDTASALPAISWASSWVCGTIAPGKYMSFWLRYRLTANSSGTSLENEDFAFSVNYRRV
jgi:hypothetical protein